MMYVALMLVVAVLFCAIEITDPAQCAMLLYLFAVGALWKNVLQHTQIATT
jgi:hypothetical protein